MTGGCRRAAGKRRDGELRGGAHRCPASIRARQRGTGEGPGVGVCLQGERGGRAQHAGCRTDIVHALQSRGAQCSIFDPEADADEIRDAYGFPVVDEPARNAPYDAVVVAVRHRVFRSMFPLELLVRERPLLIDVTSARRRRAGRQRRMPTQVPNDSVYAAPRTATVVLRPTPWPAPGRAGAGRPPGPGRRPVAQRWRLGDNRRQ